MVPGIEETGSPSVFRAHLITLPYCTVCSVFDESASRMYVGVTKREREICPPDDPPTDCFLRPIYENTMFSLPPCTAGGGYGPCEVGHDNTAHSKQIQACSTTEKTSLIRTGE